MVEPSHSIDLASVIGLLGNVLLLVWAVAGVLRRWVRIEHLRVSMILAAIIAVVPIHDLLVAGFVRGYVGDLSITTICFLALAIAFFAGAPIRISAVERDTFSVMIVISACLLYPFSLGLTQFDPYALGYGRPELAFAVLGVTLWCWYKERIVTAIVILLGVAAYLMRIYETRNLWDYLIDPFIVIVALSRLTALITRRIVEKKI